MKAGDLKKALALAAIYVVAARLGLMMDAVGGFATLVWPPTGIALAALLIFGGRLWPGVAAGALVANLWAGAPTLVAAGIAAGNTLEAVAAAWTVGRISGFRPDLGRLKDAIGLVVLAAGLSTLLSATVGSLALLLGHVIAPSGFWSTWRAWWLGDLVADLVVAPLLLVTAGFRKSTQPPRFVEAGALAALLLAVSALIFFGRWFPFVPAAFQRAYFLSPVMIWAATRFGQRGSTVSTFAVSGIAIWATALGSGPFAEASLAASLTSLQAFISVQAITFLILGAIVAEREHLFDRAVRAVKAREDTLAIVSHDLGNPLGTVTMTAQLMAEAPTDDTTRAQASRIHRAAGRMKALIGDLLDSASLEAGSFSLQRKHADANVLVRETVEGLQPAAEARAVQLTALNAEAALPLECDDARMIRVLGNLVGNAVKVCEPGRTVTVEAKAIEGGIRFEVLDEGPGIQADHGPHVFEPYWRAPSQGRQGAGLGLSISKGIVGAHGGKIWFENRAAKGCGFFVVVPR